MTLADLKTKIDQEISNLTFDIEDTENDPTEDDKESLLDYYKDQLDFWRTIQHWLPKEFDGTA